MPQVEMANDNARKIIVSFRNHQVQNEGKTKDAGRPIYDDLEVCDIRFPGETRVWGCFPADEVEPNATRELKAPITYKDFFKTQYDQFKASMPQTVAGTAIADLPFLTEGKRMELRALHIHTAEQLAALDGANLARLGMGGRELKTQAQAYLDNAGGSAKVTSMALEIERLKQLVEGLTKDKAGPTQPGATEKPLEECSDAELKNYIKEKTGEPVRGNIGREKLLARAAELAVKEPAEVES